MSRILKSKSSIEGARGCLLVFALIWNGFVLVSFLSLLRGRADLLGLLFMLPFAAIGIALMLAVFWKEIVGVKLGAPEVVVSRDTLEPGEELTFRYSLQVRKPVDVEKIGVYFVFRESATYRQGTDTTTVTHETPAYSFERPGRRYEAGETLMEEHTLQVPPGAMHTFTAPHNKLQWLVKTHVSVAKWPDPKDEYEITVTPPTP